MILEFLTRSRKENFMIETADDMVIWPTPSLEAAEADLQLARDQFEFAQRRVWAAQDIMRKARGRSWKTGKVWE